jgi:phosphatidylglycerol---prolipoprotein diacylglyceryl transferase
MHSVFRIGPLDFPAYFTLLTVGLALAILLAWHRSPRVGINPDRFLDLGLLMVVTGVIGARLLHVLADGLFWDYVHLCTDPLQVKGFRLPSGRPCASASECAALSLGELCHPEQGTCHPGRDCLRALKVWYGGLSYYGGLLLSIPVGIAYVLKHRMGVWRVADLVGYSIPLGLFFGRMGCWFAGCCFGSPTTSGFAVRYNPGSPAFEQQRQAGLVAIDALHSLPTIPAQLISAGFNFGIFLVCYFIVYPRRKYHGATFWWFLLLYGACRFAIEGFRSDDRGLWLGSLISTSQLIAIPMVLVALCMMYRGRRRYPLSKYPVSEPPGGWV